MRQKPRITPVIDRHAVKAAILRHQKAIPLAYQPYFRRPRWRPKHQLLMGADGYAIGYWSNFRSQGPATVLYQLTTDLGDRDVYYNVKQALKVVP